MDFAIIGQNGKKCDTEVTTTPDEIHASDSSPKLFMISFKKKEMFRYNYNCLLKFIALHLSIFFQQQRVFKLIMAHYLVAG